MFQFIFQGTRNEFLFFRHILEQKVEGANLTLDKIHEDEFHCAVTNDGNIIFKTGMIVSACYSKFKHLKNTQFDDEQ